MEKQTQQVFFLLFDAKGRSKNYHFSFLSRHTQSRQRRFLCVVTNNQPLFILFYCFLDKKVLGGSLGERRTRRRTMEREESMYNRTRDEPSTREENEYERTDEEKLEFVRAVWRDITEGAQELVSREPLLGGLIYSKILNQPTFEKSLSYVLSSKIANAQVLAGQWQELMFEAIQKEPVISYSAATDIRACVERDPACPNPTHCFLFYKGFHGLQTQRVSHWLWGHERKPLACYMQSLVSEKFGMDLHPAAMFGRGVMIDHATSIVVGETAVIGDGCTLFHGVTLGGTGKIRGDRHPKLGKRVVVGSNASILGNVKVADDCKIGSSAVLVHDVPRGTTIVGTKGKVLSGKYGSALRSRL